MKVQSICNSKYSIHELDIRKNLKLTLKDQYEREFHELEIQELVRDHACKMVEQLEQIHYSIFKGTRNGREIWFSTLPNWYKDFCCRHTRYKKSSGVPHTYIHKEKTIQALWQIIGEEDTSSNYCKWLIDFIRKHIIPSAQNDN
ncbi:MAG TPA: hypothetical protein VF679_13155 [Pedobacter sp.]|jgi:hypothetical protein